MNKFRKTDNNKIFQCHTPNSMGSNHDNVHSRGFHEHVNNEVKDCSKSLMAFISKYADFIVLTHQNLIQDLKYFYISVKHIFIIMKSISLFIKTNPDRKSVV